MLPGKLRGIIVDRCLSADGTMPGINVLSAESKGTENAKLRSKLLHFKNVHHYLLPMVFYLSRFCSFTLSVLFFYFYF